MIKQRALLLRRQAAALLGGLALLAAQFAVGFLMPHIRRDTPMEGLVAWHVSLGTAILFFLVIRALWRVAKPVPLYWVYVTAWATPDGVVQFRDDIYNRDGLGAIAATQRG